MFAIGHALFGFGTMTYLLRSTYFGCFYPYNNLGMIAGESPEMP